MILDVDIESKYFNGLKVLDKIRFKVDLGEKLLVLGPNGAGKTTLFRCILGLLNFNGVIRINGRDVKSRPKEIKKIIGYVPQAIHFPPMMTGGKIVKLHSNLHGIDVDEYELLEKFELDDVVDVPVKEYSGGMRQRLAIAIALSHDPKLLLMDEPFSNLDYKGRKILIEMLRGDIDSYRSTLITMHRLTDVIAYCDKALLLDIYGRMAFYGSIDEFIMAWRVKRVLLKVPKKSLEEFKGRIIDRIGGWILIETKDIFGLLERLSGDGRDIGPIIIEEPSLEDLIKEAGIIEE